MMRSSKFFLIATPALIAGSLLAQDSGPEIPYDSAPNLLTLPENIHMGEAVGVATNSKGNLFVYTRTGNTEGILGGSRVFTHGGARLFEFDPKGKFIREIGQGVYGFMFAHVVRVDPQDNIWVVDEGSNIIMKFNPEGRILMTLGRKPESVNIPAAEAGGEGRGGRGGRGGGAGEGGGGRGGRGGLPGAGAAGDNFNRPTDVAWDPQ